MGKGTTSGDNTSEGVNGAARGKEKRWGERMKGERGGGGGRGVAGRGGRTVYRGGAKASHKCRAVGGGVRGGNVAHQRRGGK